MRNLGVLCTSQEKCRNEVIELNNKLFVAGLPWSYTQDDLSKLFSEVGSVVSAMVIMDKITGRSRGFGFVEMSSGEEAKEAIAKFHGYDLGVNGRKLVVNEARPRS